MGCLGSPCLGSNGLYALSGRFAVPGTSEVSTIPRGIQTWKSSRVFQKLWARLGSCLIRSDAPPPRDSSWWHICAMMPFLPPPQRMDCSLIWAMSSTGWLYVLPKPLSYPLACVFTGLGFDACSGDCCVFWPAPLLEAPIVENPSEIPISSVFVRKASCLAQFVDAIQSF